MRLHSSIGFQHNFSLRSTAKCFRKGYRGWTSQSNESIPLFPLLDCPVSYELPGLLRGSSRGFDQPFRTQLRVKGRRPICMSELCGPRWLTFPLTACMSFLWKGSTSLASRGKPILHVYQLKHPHAKPSCLSLL